VLTASASKASGKIQAEVHNHRLILAPESSTKADTLVYE
jgi:hypothetical protein